MTIGQYGPPRFRARDRVLTQVEPTAPAQTAAARAFQSIGKTLNAAREFVRPAVEKEQQDRGTNEAADAIREGRFQMRKPYTLRSQAFNAAGERILGAKARTAYSQGVGEVIRSARNADELQGGLAALIDASMDDLGPEFANVRAGLEAQSAAMFELAKGRFSKGASIGRRDKAAARSVRAAGAETVRAAADPDMTPEAAAAVLGEALGSVAEFGPPGAFEVGGIKYPADAKRPGLYSVDELAAIADDMGAMLAEASVVAKVRGAEVLAPAIRDLEDGKGSLPKASADAALRAALTEQNVRNVARRSAEERAAAALGDFASRPIPPTVPTPATLKPFARLDEETGRRAAVLEAELAELAYGYAQSEVERRLGTLAPAGDAEHVRELQAYLMRLVEISEDGRVADDTALLDELRAFNPNLDAGRAKWGGEVARLIEQVKEQPPVTVEDVEAVEVAARGLLAEGSRHARESGVADLVEREALDKAGRAVAAREARHPVKIVEASGREVAQIDVTDMLTMTASLVERADQMKDARLTLGLSVGADITDGEAAKIAHMLENATLAERIEFLEAFEDMKPDDRRRLSLGFRAGAPLVAAAITAAPFALDKAARAIAEPPVVSALDTRDIEAFGGASAADLAADLAAVGVAEPAERSLAELGDETLMTARAGRIPPEDLADDAGMAGPILAANAEREFDRPADEADTVQGRILAEPMARRLAEAVQYEPSSPEAVQSFTRALEELEALPPEDQEAYLLEARGRRVSERVNAKPRPLYYSGDEVTLEGLRSAAGAIVREYRRGVITEATYLEQSRLIAELVEELNG